VKHTKNCCDDGIGCRCGVTIESIEFSKQRFGLHRLVFAVRWRIGKSATADPMFAELMFHSGEGIKSVCCSFN